MVYAQQPFEDLAHIAWFAQIRNMSRVHFYGKLAYSWFSCRKKIWTLEESLNMRGRKIVEKTGSPFKNW
jgi:hypothetical protein